MEGVGVMIDRVRRIIKDNSFGDDQIFDYINDGIYEVAMIVRPPSLIVFDYEITFAANTNIAPAPADFLGPSLMIAKLKASGMNLAVSSRVTEFDVQFSRRLNVLHSICAKGNSFLINSSPTTETIVLVTYLKNPTIYLSMSDNGSTIDAFVPRIGENAVVAYAAKEIFNIIEDGVDGDKRNTANYERVFATAISRLGAHYGIENSEAMPSFIVHGGISDSSSSPSVPSGRRMVVAE